MLFRGSCDKFNIKFYANRMRTKVNFELSIEISKDVCPSFHERGKKTKF